jgi:hypothetical protein
MIIVLTVRDTVIKGHTSNPNRTTPDQNLAWSLLLHDINFLAFAKGKK